MIETQEFTTVTKDNNKIAMNYYNGINSAEVVIIAPGWCMTKDSVVFKKISDMFKKYFDVISFDFRGHGKSSGFYTFSAHEVYDMDAVIDFAVQKSYQKIYLAGFSLGAAVSIIQASKNKNITKVIAVSAPCDFSKIENSMWKKAAWFETLKKFELDRFLSLRMNIFPKKKIKPIDVVDKITAPTLFLAGENDQTVYPWHTKSLFEKATCKKEFKLFKKGFHAEDLYLYFSDEFTTLCINWLKQ